MKVLPSTIYPFKARIYQRALQSELEHIRINKRLSKEMELIQCLLHPVY